MFRISGIFGDQKKKQEDKSGRKNKGAALAVHCAVSSSLPSRLRSSGEYLLVHLLMGPLFLEEENLCWSSQWWW